MQIGVPIGPAPLLVSGVQYHRLDDADVLMLTAFRLLRQQGNGSLALEFRDWKCTRFDVHPNVGGPQLMNSVLSDSP